MEINKLKDLAPPSRPEPREEPAGRRPRGAKRRGQVPELLCHCAVPEKRAIFVGSDDGRVVCWRSRRDGHGGLTVSSWPAHLGSVQSVAFAPDLGANGILFSASADRTVKSWDPWDEDNADSIQTMAGHGATVSQVVYRKRTVLSSSHDGTVRVWQMARGRRLMLNPWFSHLATLDVGSEWATCLGIRSGERLTCFVGDGSGGITVFASRAGEEEQRAESGAAGQAGGPAPDQAPLLEASTFQRVRRQAHAHSLGVRDMLVVGTEQFVITAASDGTLRVHDALQGARMFHQENERHCRYSALAWSGRAQELVAGDEQGWVEVWQLHARKMVAATRVATCPVRGVAVLDRAFGQQLVVTHAHGVSLWELDRDLKFTKADGHEDSVIALQCVTTRGWHSSRDPGGEEDALVGSLNPALSRLEDMARGRSSSRRGGRGAEARGRSAEATRQRGGMSPPASGGEGKDEEGKDEEDNEDEDAGIAGAAETMEGTRIVSASVDNTIRVWDPHDMQTLYTLRATVSEISCMVLLEGEGLLATGSDDGSVRWWNPETGSSVSRRHHTNTVSCMCVVERGGMPSLATGSFDGTVVVWDLSQQRALQPRAECRFEAHRGEEAEILAMAYLAPRVMWGPEGGSVSPPASRAASRSPVPAGTRSGSESPAWHRGRTSPRGAARHAFLLTGGNDRVLRVWNLEVTAVEAPVAELRGHEEAITRLVVDGAMVYAGGDNGTVRLWNMRVPQSAYVVRVVRAHAGRAVRDIALLPDAGVVATCAGDGLIRVWDTASPVEETGPGAAHGARLLQQCEYGGELFCLAYRAGERSLMAGASEGKIVSFRVEDEVFESAARAHDDDDELWDALAAEGVDVTALREAT